MSDYITSPSCVARQMGYKDGILLRDKRRFETEAVQKIYDSGYEQGVKDFNMQAIEQAVEFEKMHGIIT